MSTKKSKIQTTGWDAAIADAKLNIKRLQVAISVFEENKAKGDPWPGSQVDNQTTKSCHSV
jgi:hypothetical protein